MGGKLPVGFEPINTSLDAKIGQSCSSAMAGVKIDPRAYLGANPETALGSAADKRSTWKSNMGNNAFTGTLSKNGEYYKCGFSVTSMPNTGIMELSLKRGSSSLDVIEDKERFLVRKVGGSTVVLDSELSPQSDAFVGGTYGCSMGGGPKLTPHKLKELKDFLDNCPQCGRISVMNGSTIYELNNISKVTGAGIGKEVSSMVKKHGTKAKKGVRAHKGMRGKIRGKAVHKGKTASKASTKKGKVGKVGKASKANKATPVNKGATKGKTTKGVSKSKAYGKAGPG